jgi:hypothetical protein
MVGDNHHRRALSVLFRYDNVEHSQFTDVSLASIHISVMGAAVFLGYPEG